MIKVSRFAAFFAVPLVVLAVACGGGDDDDSPSASTNGGAGSTASDSTGSTGGTGAAPTGSTGGGTGAAPTADSGGATGATGGGATGPATGGTTGAATSSDDFDPENCPELQALAESAGMEDAFGGDFLAADFNVENFQRLADNSPSEIRSDMQLLADVLTKFFEKFEELEVDFSNPASFASLTEAELAELEELTTELDTPEVQAASERVEAYFAEVCS